MFSYPNPFRDALTVEYELANSSVVKIEVYDFTGRKITELQNKVEEAGNHSKVFDGIKLNSGMYFLKITVDQNEYVTKVAIQK